MGKKKVNDGPIKRTRGQEVWHQFKKNKGAVIGMIMIAILLFVTIYAQVHYDWDKDIASMNITQVLKKPTAEHIMGTDHMGRDVMARIFYGAKYSLIIGLSVTVLSTIGGLIIGSVAAYYGGIIDDLIMRVSEIFIMIPAMLLTIVIVSVIGVSMNNLILALSLSGIPYMAKVVRAAVLPIRGSDYVESAKALGVSDFMIIMTHILPNSLSPVIVSVTLKVGSTIVGAAGYSFIGLGVPTPTPEWGAMLSDARQYMRDYPYLVLFPGLAIVYTALAFNLMGDGLRDALDPKLRR